MNDISRNVDLASDSYSVDVDRGERIIRAVLLAGFLAVLAVEAWLLWQWIQLLA
ncbi:MAG: hypothetical protein R3191_05230 [Anaerolineales bacterium]|nr:hypothetical protein [Anaerolineales bacterium]